MTPLTPTLLLEWIRNPGLRSQGTGILRLKVEKSDKEDNFMGGSVSFYLPFCHNKSMKNIYLGGKKQLITAGLQSL